MNGTDYIDNLICDINDLIVDLEYLLVSCKLDNKSIIKI